MVKKCVVNKCPIKARTKVGQFGFPLKRDLCLRWIEACGRGPDFKPSINSRVCEIHFRETDFRPSEGKQRKRLILGAVPCLNLGNAELTLEAQKLVQLQRDADRRALDAAKEALERSKTEQENRFKNNLEIQHPVYSIESSNVAERISPEPFRIGIEPLQDRLGLKIDLPRKLIKYPGRIARIFRDNNVRDFFKTLASKTNLGSNGSRKRLSADSKVSIMVCPIGDSEDPNKRCVKKVGEMTVEEVMTEAWNQNFGPGAKKRKPVPQWFRQGDSNCTSSKPAPPPAELKNLKPVPVSGALHLLFDTGAPELPPPPEPLPPISAKLIFVEKENTGENGENINGSVPMDMASGGDQSHHGVMLQTAKEIPPGPIAILDPDGLRREVSHWRSKVEELQRINYSLEIRITEVESENKKLSQEVKSSIKMREREATIEKKKKQKRSVTVSKMKNELANLRKFKRQIITSDRINSSKCARVVPKSDKISVIRVDETDQLDLESHRKNFQVDADTETIIVETDSDGKMTCSRNLNDLFDAALSQSENFIISSEGDANMVSKLPIAHQDISQSTTTVMLPPEVVYSSEEDEYQHIEIITVSMDHLDPAWKKIGQ